MRIHCLPNLEYIMCVHFDLICGKVEEVNKQFARFDNMQARHLYKSFICSTRNIFEK